MKIQFAYCIGGPMLEYEIVDANTLRINGAEYFFNPGFVEFNPIASTVEGVIFAAFDIHRDETGELCMTCYQGKEES